MFEEVVVGIWVAEPRNGGPKSVLAKKMALVCTHTTHLVEGCHQRSACHFAVLVDNNVQGHWEQPGQKNSLYCN